MSQRLAIIVFIFFGAWIGWAILGDAVQRRTYAADAALRKQVESVWGAPQTQHPPQVLCDRLEIKKQIRYVEGKEVAEETPSRVMAPVTLEQSRITADLNLAHRQKGLLWYSTYQVAFAGTFRFATAGCAWQEAVFRLPLPAKQSIYDEVTFEVNGTPQPFRILQGAIEAKARVPGPAAVLKVGYRHQGMGQWNYSFGADGVHEVRDFDLTMTTNFRDVGFTEQTLSPQAMNSVGDGWQLRWTYATLLSGTGIGVVMPEKLQPGPLAAEISRFAPVPLLFFFFVIFAITTLRSINLHPMNYFFLATGFFAFHLLMAYLVDHISIQWAFLICSAVSLFLVVSYLRLVVGTRFAAVEAGISQFIYLVLFSCAFFFKGFTGLAVTIGTILTLFVVMQLTAKIRWEEKFST